MKWSRVKRSGAKRWGCRPAARVVTGAAAFGLTLGLFASPGTRAVVAGIEHDIDDGRDKGFGLHGRPAAPGRRAPDPHADRRPPRPPPRPTRQCPAAGPAGFPRNPHRSARRRCARRWPTRSPWPAARVGRSSRTGSRADRVTGWREPRDAWSNRPCDGHGRSQGDRGPRAVFVHPSPDPAGAWAHVRFVPGRARPTWYVTRSKDYQHYPQMIARLKEQNFDSLLASGAGGWSARQTQTGVGSPVRRPEHGVR